MNHMINLKLEILLSWTIGTMTSTSTSGWLVKIVKPGARYTSYPNDILAFKIIIGIHLI